MRKEWAKWPKLFAEMDRRKKAEKALPKLAMNRAIWQQSEW
jgi:hypothetical protein